MRFLALHEHQCLRNSNTQQRNAETSKALLMSGFAHPSLLDSILLLLAGPTSKGSSFGRILLFNGIVLSYFASE